MASEITVRGGMQINKTDAVTGAVEKYTSPQQGFQKTKTNIGGPTPGQILVPMGGCAISLSVLTTPGVCEFYNLDATNYVTIGIRDPATGAFYPLIEIGPGENWVIPLSRSILQDWYNTGTGTTGPTKQLWADADTASVKLVVNVFER